MKRAFTRWSDRNPLLAVCLGALVSVLILCLAYQWDESDRAAIYWAAQQRGTT